MMSAGADLRRQRHPRGRRPARELFIAARFVAGLAVGAASVISPVYISEVTPAAIRGRLSSVQQVMIIAGLTGAFLSNYWLAATAGASTETFWLGYPAWRWMFWMQVIPAGIYFLALLLIPESPRYLMLKGRDAEAGTVLTKLFGSAYANEKVREIRDSFAADHHRPKFSDLLDLERPRPQDRLGRHRPRRVPAARRHQHRLLLRVGAVAVGRLQRE